MSSLPSDHDATLGAEALERIAAYESWAAKLESTLADYERRHGLYVRFFIGLTAAGFACFLFGSLPGVWGSFSACLISGVGYGMLRARFWELRAEITEMHNEIDRIRSGASRPRR